MFEYYCTKCQIKITTEKQGYIECPSCKEDRNIRDFEDYDQPIHEYFSDYNWNKK